MNPMMLKGYVIRKATNDDIPAIAALLRQEKNGAVLPVSKETLAQWTANGHSFIAEFEGQIIGYQGASVWQPGLIEGRSHYVTPEHRKNNLGYYLKGALFEELTSNTDHWDGEALTFIAVKNANSNGTSILLGLGLRELTKEEVGKLPPAVMELDPTTEYKVYAINLKPSVRK